MRRSRLPEGGLDASPEKRMGPKCVAPPFPHFLFVSRTRVADPNRGPQRGRERECVMSPFATPCPPARCAFVDEMLSLHDFDPPPLSLIQIPPASTRRPLTRPRPCSALEYLQSRGQANQASASRRVSSPKRIRDVLPSPSRPLSMSNLDTTPLGVISKWANTQDKAIHRRSDQDAGKGGMVENAATDGLQRRVDDLEVGIPVILHPSSPVNASPPCSWRCLPSSSWCAALLRGCSFA